MFYSKFQEVLDHFNFIEGTDAKCGGQCMLQYIVSGLTEEQHSRLHTVVHYHPDRHIGVGVIRSVDVPTTKVEDKVETNQDNYTIKHIDLKVGDYLLREDFSKSQWSFLQENWKPNVEWYSSKEEAMTHFSIIRVFDSYEEVRIGSSNGNEIRASDRLITPDMLLWRPMYNPENIIVTCKGITLTTSKVPLQPKKEKPLLKYTELWMADTSKDVMDFMMDELTHGKCYAVVSTDTNVNGEMLFKIVDDSGYMDTYHHKWFKPARLYDEDESELICRDIEFKEGDYIDKHNWTSEQLVHLSKFYKFYRLSTACKKDLSFLIWDHMDNEFVSGRDFECIGKEYTYDDIFYSEEI